MKLAIHAAMFLNRVLLSFYKNLLPATGLITLIGLVFCFGSKSYPFAITFTLTKIVTNGIIGLGHHTLKNHELIYFNNLGFPSRELYSKVFLMDMVIWFTLLAFIFQL